VTDSADVARDGSFSVSLRIPGDSILTVLVDETFRGNRQFFPWLGVVRRDDLSRKLDVARIPREWEIRRGAYAGTTVSISLEAAHAPVGTLGGWAFFPRERVAPFQPVTHAYSTLFIPPENRPMPIAVDSKASVPLTEPEVAAFWKGVDSLETLLGEDLFRPVTLPELNAIQDNRGVRVEVNKGRFEVYYIYQPATMEILGGYLGFDDAQVLASPPELFHRVLFLSGLGPTCSWPSVSWRPTCPSGGPETTLSPADIAYWELFYATQELRKTSGAQGMAESHQGERRYLLGLPVEATRYLDN